MNNDGSDKQVPIVIGKSLKPRCIKNTKKILSNDIQIKNMDDHEHFHGVFKGIG
jgi:hypothetical protein